MGAGLTIEPPTGTVTLMFTDIVGSTALRDALVAGHGENDGNRLYRERFLEPHNERIRAFLKEHHGFEVKTNGDSFMVAFALPEDAVRCAVDLQRSLRDEPIVTDNPSKPLSVRIGIHTGVATLVKRDGKVDYDGHAVNIASRVESLLKGGERIYCSRETAALAKTGPGIRYHSYGPYLLKGLSEKTEIVDVLWDDAMQPTPPEQPHERLPYPWLTQWVGREREMTALEDALRASRLVTLHGIGGVGKTRLAVETLLARGGGLPREIVFVTLERVADAPEGLLFRSGAAGQDRARLACGLGDDTEQPRERLFISANRRSRRQSREGHHLLRGGAAGQDGARVPGGLGDDAEQPRGCVLEFADGRSRREPGEDNRLLRGGAAGLLRAPIDREWSRRRSPSALATRRA